MNRVFFICILFFSTSIYPKAEEVSKDTAKEIEKYRNDFHIKKAKFAINSIEREEEVKSSLHDYKLYSLEHRKSTFEFQYIQTIVVFVIVAVMVISGLALSWWQFFLDFSKKPRESSKSAKMKVDEGGNVNSLDSSESESDQKNVPSKLKISKDGIEISSSVIGFIMLIISFAFLYLYLSLTYQISEVSPPNPDHENLPAKKSGE